MKRIDTPHSYNWVDENNRMVGYDSDRQCCESSGYEWVNEKGEGLGDRYDDMPGLNFTGKHDYPEFDVELEGDLYEPTYLYAFEASNGTETIWLCLYNSHNGYYSHGFQFKKDDHVITENCL